MPLLVFPVAVSACGGGSANEREKTAPPPIRVSSADVATAQQGTISTGPLISGELTPERSATVRAQVGGSIVQTSADEGQRVRKGAPLARIEARDLDAAVASARAAVDSAQHALQVTRTQAMRTETLVEAGALAQEDLDTARNAVIAAQAQLANTRAQLAAARQQLADTTVASPIAGIVSRKSVNVGDVVSPGAALYTVIDPSSMRLSAFVPSEAIGDLHVGDPVAFTVRGYEDRLFTGHVQRISPAADPATRQVPVLIAIPNADGHLIAGLYAQGRVNSQSRSGLVVPLSAVDRRGGSPLVTRLEDGKAAHVNVTLGIDDPDSGRVLVTAGLRAGDRVLLGAARTSTPGTPITVVPREPAPSEPAPGTPDEPAAP